jgi:chaperonin cofactor prefoldin
VNRKGSLLGAALLGLVAATDAWADTPEALRDAAATALQKLDQFVAKESERLGKDARATREVGVQFKSAAEQTALLNDRLKNQKSALEQQIGAIQEQIQKLDEQAEKLRVIHQKMTELMPKLMKAFEDDRSGEASQQILSAVAQDQARAIRLADAIEQRNADQASSVLRKGIDGVRVQVGDLPKGEGATVTFRVGSLVHCLSTIKRCRGAASSLGKAASREAPDPDALLKQLHSLVTVANRETAGCNKRVEELLGKAASMPGGPPTGTAEQKAALRRLMARLVTLQATSTQLSRDLAAALDKVIRRA